MQPYKQSFAWWSFAEGPVQVPNLLAEAAGIGLQGVDFLPQDLWPQAKQLGLELAIIDGHEVIEIGFNDRTKHSDLSDQVRRNLDLAVREGVHNLSVAPGDKIGISDADAMDICVEALTPLAAEAQAAGVGLLLEPLNSKVDHAGHQCDTTAWGAELIDRVNSPALKLLYDAYHMQIMEGDLSRTIEANLHRIGHIHTAGVPGRSDLDDEQEVNWKGIAHRLRTLGFDGFVAHEFIPRADPVAALRQAYAHFADSQP